MTGAMYAAVAGLRTHMSALNVIGNNISNVNTNAYKATRYVFKEAIYTTSRGGSDGTRYAGGMNPAQIGYGCSIGSIDLDMSTKTFSPTTSATDVCLDGDGFFMVGEKGKVFGSGTNATAKPEDLYLTRRGDFYFDSQGYLVDGEGQVVYGWMSVPNPDFDDTKPVDSKTNPETIVSPVLTEIRYPMADENGNAVFCTNKDGVITDAAEGDTVEVGGKERESTGKRCVFDSVSIGKDGRITGSTANGEVVVIGVIAVGKVDNPNGVTHVNGHYYQAMDGAGSLTVCSVNGGVENTKAADGTNDLTDGEVPILNAGKTTMQSGGLESSGTELANEISNMIMIQRGYQANTRIVTVTDSMLEELVNMKR